MPPPPHRCATAGGTAGDDPAAVPPTGNSLPIPPDGWGGCTGRYALLRHLVRGMPAWQLAPWCAHSWTWRITSRPGVSACWEVRDETPEEGLIPPRPLSLGGGPPPPPRLPDGVKGWRTATGAAVQLLRGSDLPSVALRIDAPHPSAYAASGLYRLAATVGCAQSPAAAAADAG
eukprot:gene34053-4493_t